MLAAALTILLSSFLLFLVQPIIAKEILPWFGGSAGVWTVCLVFFQVALLLGYTYAHWLTRRMGPRQFVLHIVLLLASCLTLPIIPGAFWKPEHGGVPALQILGLLAATVGPPYVLLASTAPLLQRWLSGAPDNPAPRRAVYRLFAISNFGSLAGLLSYPFAIEPFAPVQAHAWVWSAGYVLFVLCCTRYAWGRHRSAETAPERASPAAGAYAPALTRYAYWVGCSALGSTLLLSGTNQITQNVASIPLLWVVPLAVYLLSFVVCFEGRSGHGWYERRYWLTAAMLATATMAWAMFAEEGNLSVYVALPVFTAGLFLGCVTCHGELARSKPSPEYLTHFYLSLAAGGALGGLLVGVLAPLVFDGYWEMPLALLALAALGVYCCAQEARRVPDHSWAANLIVATPAAGLIVLVLGAVSVLPDGYSATLTKIATGSARWGCIALVVLCAGLLQHYRLWRSETVIALLCTLCFDLSYYRSTARGTEFAARNFYGTLRVVDSSYGSGQLRRLRHGVIVHGSQWLQAPQHALPTTYYGESSGIGRTIRAEQHSLAALRIGSVGLGAGTLAAYGRSSDRFRVYELNPAVLDIAERQFSYLKDSKAQIEPVLGDARLSLEQDLAQGAFSAPEQRFDVLSLDAFSGDAIPVHLLTAQAFATYTRVIKPDGVIAFHLSNRYLNLPPVVEQIARNAGYQAVLVADRPSAPDLISPSDWVLVTRSATFLRRPEIAVAISAITPRAGLPEWTDQFTNLFQILK